MKIVQVLLGLTAVVLFNSCSGVRIDEHNEWKQYFDKYKAENGCFEMYDNNKEIAAYYNKKGSAEQIAPLATFDIFNSLVALEMDAAPNELMMIKWDGVTRPDSNWNQDLTMAQAFKYNATPYFQELARKIGQNKMQHYLDTVHYGNATIGKQIDQFWVNGTLKISADEQVGLMKRIYHSELPAFSDRSQRIVRGMMLQGEGKNYRLYYKSAIDSSSDTRLVWLVGYVEQFVSLRNVETKQINDIPHPYFFALHFTTKENGAAIQKAQLGILKDIFKEQNIELDK